MSLLRYLAGKTDPTFRRDRVSNRTVSIYTHTHTRLYNILYIYVPVYPYIRDTYIIHTIYPCTQTVCIYKTVIIIRIRRLPLIYYYYTSLCILLLLLLYYTTRDI